MVILKKNNELKNKNIESKYQNKNIDDLFEIKKLPITSKEKNGIFEAWVESSDL